MSIMKSVNRLNLKSVKSISLSLVIILLCGCIFETSAQNRKSGKKKAVKKENTEQNRRLNHPLNR